MGKQLVGNNALKDLGKEAEEGDGTIVGGRGRSLNLGKKDNEGALPQGKEDREIK